MSDGFRNRVATNVVPIAQRDPAAMRSGIAEGLSTLGQALGQAASQDAQVKEQVAASQYRIQQEQQRRTRSATIADRAGAWAETQAAIAGEIDTMRTKSKPGAAGHAEAVNALVTQRTRDFFGTLPDDPEVRERFGPMIAEYAASTKLGEQRWGLASQAKYEGDSVGKWADITGNGIVAAPSRGDAVSKLAAAISGTDALVGGLDVPGTERARLTDATKSGFVQNFADGRLAAGDGQALRAVLESGQFDGFLDPRMKANYLRQIDVAQAQAAREVEQAAGQRKSDARKAIDTIEAKVAAGVVPQPAEVRAARAQAERAGVDPAELVKFDALDVKVQVNRSYGGLIGKPGGADAIRGARDALAARIAGGRGSEGDQMARAQMDGLVDKADTAEAAQLKELAGQGVGGAVTALGMLTGTPAARQSKAGKIARELAPIANVSATAQVAVLGGREVLKARKGEFGVDTDARTAMQGLLGSLAGKLGGQYDDLRDASWAIMADELARHGKAGFDARAFRRGFLLMTGARARENGVIEGGIQPVRGAAVHLPGWMSAPEFDSYVSRRDFGQAVYGDGRAVDKADVLGNYRPEWFGADQRGRPAYHFIDASGDALVDKGGSPVVMFVDAPK